MQRNDNLIYLWKQNRAEHKLVVEQHRERRSMPIALFAIGCVLSFGLCVIGAAGYWMPMVWHVWRGVGL